ncbi:S-adenosyl-L-methionine-dependent methyltransferase [Moniliophthora roreri MCA 2997]|uniref:S-adenosyl-L-methionine-dependent methyltransferase n=1 Tax=Moniliophthora roreri (strain MCA 2997) TaxID=1381753 RepID=V2Y0B9_MONRO|nr:S-adenosyl-L-methionine-dependent methyltransferase [Moniliophthora roreri MCA 2997]
MSFEKKIGLIVKPDVYANNRLSIKLISKNALVDLVGIATDEFNLTPARVNEVDFVEPHVADGTAFERVTGYKLFNWYKLPENKEKAERFSRAMAARIDLDGNFLPKVYPWTKYPSECRVCDVAGGNGHYMIDLLKKHPNFKAVIQDQPMMIEQAKEYWTKEHPQAIEEKKVDFVPFNFFTDRAVEGCDVYYLKSILCASSFNRYEVAMPSPARYAQCPEDRAPEPLLPNWGAPTARTYEMDFMMMLVLGARERTLEELISLWYGRSEVIVIIHVTHAKILNGSEMCGLQFRKLYPAGEMDLMEFIPV